MQLIGFSNYLNGLKTNLCKFRQHKSVMHKNLLIIIFSVVTTPTQLSFIYYNYKCIKATMLGANYFLF